MYYDQGIYLWNLMQQKMSQNKEEITYRKKDIKHVMS